MKAEYKKSANRRAKIIEGQFRGLIKAIDEDSYCVDILVQSLAIQKSLKSLNKLVLQNHMETHVKEGMSNGTEEQQEKLITELLELYELTNVRG